MSDKKKVVVAGLGEVGRPLRQLFSEKHDVIGVDIEPLKEKITDVDVLHVCFPFEIRDFVGEAARYMELFNPRLTIIESTVGVGTTRAVAQRTGRAVVHSPVRGKHARMLDEMRSYTKFVGPLERAVGEEAARHYQSVGLKTKVLSTPEASELAKLSETTYFGVMIAWAQQLERYCDKTGASYDEVVSIYDEIKFFPPVKYFPGVIGGHCVMPNIKILGKILDSELLNAVESSNQKKVERDAKKAEESQQLRTVTAVAK